MKIKLIAAFVAATTMAASNANAEVEVSTKGGGLSAKMGDSSIQIGGRLMYDYNRAEENGIVDEDQFDERRARLYVKGNFNKDWGYKINFNVDGSGFEDLYVSYKGFGDLANVTIGNQRVPFSLQDQTSSNDISVLERSGITEQYAPARKEGVMLHGKNAKMTYGIMTFFDDVNEEENGEEVGLGGRITYAPIKSESSLVHLGAAYYDIENASAMGVEGAFVSGPLHLQAEYMDGEFDGEDKNGFYVQAGYVLTGETLPYKDGKFSKIKPAGKGGAWELVARYEDGDGNHSDIELGRTDATAYTLGMNWYANNNVRIGVNYTEGEDNLSNDEGSEFRVRFAFKF